MKISVLVILALVAVACAMPEESSAKAFRHFQQKYNKTYSVSEFNTRYGIFKAAIQRAAQRQVEDPTATYGITKFSDLTPEEFAKFYLMPKDLHRRSFPEKEFAQIPPAKQVPSSFDWNDKGAITPVYNQEQCGSCWAFSATETIESYYFLNGKGALTSFSMQQIVDCDTTSYGCNGGWTYSAYEYVESAGGIEPLSDYPYTAETDQCQFNSADVVATVTNWQYITQSDDENAMLQWTYQNGPLSVCVDAASWQYYTGGVLTSCGNQIDHCVQLTGFSTQQGTNAWNVRNSWGADWGVNGYIYIGRGGDVCSIGDVVTVVTTGN